MITIILSKKRYLLAASSLLILLILTGLGWSLLKNKQLNSPTPTPTPIPTFVPEITLSPKPTSISRNGCIVWGCNGELCIDKDSERRDTICLYHPRYECFRTATCERQTDGHCAWTQTAELKNCLSKFKN